jgi:hypothetical protein
MGRKKLGDIPPSIQRRKDGADVAIWLPSDLIENVRVVHGQSRWGKQWTPDDTWRAAVRYGLPRLRMWMERDRVPRILWRLKRGES